MESEQKLDNGVGVDVSANRPSVRERWENSHFAVRSLVVGWVPTIGGVFLLWHASTLTDDIVGSNFWSELATTLIALGLLGIVYESYLKSALIHDIRRDLTLNSRLLGAGLTDVTHDPGALRMRELFGTSSRVDIFPASPLSWHDKNIAWLTQLASERKITFKLYLPEARSYSDVRRTSIGDQNHETPEYCATRFDQVQSSWDASDLGGSGSSLETFAYTGYPHGGFIVADKAAVIFIEDPRGKNTEQHSLAYVYEGTGATATIEWLRGVIKRLEMAPVAGSTRDVRDRSEILPRSDELRDFGDEVGAVTPNE